MKKETKEAIIKRRSFYNISNSSPISDKEIEEILTVAIKHVPSAFNSQSTRFVLLLKENHKRFWEITKEELRKIIPEEKFKDTEDKIDNCFGAGYGTVLFFEDQEVVENLMSQFPTYADNFPLWSSHSTGMHQYVVWMLLEEAGLGASLQHYNPIVDDAVKKEWGLNSKWKLVAQMPFGTPVAQPGEKQFSPLEHRLLIF